jgi:hypothetical protein
LPIFLVDAARSFLPAPRHTGIASEDNRRAQAGANLFERVGARRQSQMRSG